MESAVTLLVFRFDPDVYTEPRYQEYVLHPQGELSVLALLNNVQLELDPTLSFRSFCCGLQMCGSCLMRVDGKRRFACITLVKPGESITIDPLTFPEGHIKDLVCEIDDADDDKESP